MSRVPLRKGVVCSVALGSRPRYAAVGHIVEVARALRSPGPGKQLPHVARERSRVFPESGLCAGRATASPASGRGQTAPRPRPRIKSPPTRGARPRRRGSHRQAPPPLLRDGTWPRLPCRPPLRRTPCFHGFFTPSLCPRVFLLLIVRRPPLPPRLCLLFFRPLELSHVAGQSPRGWARALSAAASSRTSSRTRTMGFRWSRPGGQLGPSIALR